jgi:hypothetical protein
MEFPKTQLELKLKKWWQRKAASPLRRRVPDPRETGGTVFDIQPVVSSQEVVQILVEIERILGFKLDTSSIIKRGGYKNVEEFVTHVLPQLQTRFLNHNKVPQRTPKPKEGVIVNAG